MVSILEAAKTGTGIYSIRDAARFAGVPQATLTRWFFGTTKTNALRNPQIDLESTKQIGFLDLIESRAVRYFRTTYQIPFEKIREATETAKSKYGLEHPFAQRRHKTFLIGKDIFITPNGETNPIGLTGKDRDQEQIQKCVEPYMADLEFDDKGLANLFIASSRFNHRILLDPKINFGTPYVEGTGYAAETLWRAVLAEGSYDEVSELYEVPTEAVEAAFRYCSDLQLVA